MDWNIFDVRTCRGCGCTDDEGCWPPCFWVDQAWCSACEVRAGRRLTIIAAALAFAGSAGAVVASALQSTDHTKGAVSVAVVTVLAVVSALLLARVARRMLEVAS